MGSVFSNSIRDGEHAIMPQTKPEASRLKQSAPKLLKSCEELLALLDANAEAWQIKADGPIIRRARAAIDMCYR